MSAADQELLPDDGERYLPWMTDPSIGYEHLHRYWFARGLARGKRVLDLACGEGYGSALLAETAAAVVGIDLNPVVIRHAAGRYARPNLKFTVGSMTAVPIGGSGGFDLIACFEALEHVAEHDALLDEVKRLLHPAGLFIVSTPNKRVYTDEAGYENPHHVKELYWEELKALIEGRFAHARWFGQQLYPGGVIFPLDAPAAGAEECVIERGASEFTFADPGRKVPRYFVAVASDAPVPPPDALPGSFLVDASGEMVHVQAMRDLEIHLANVTRTLREREQLTQELAEAHQAEVARLEAERHHAVLGREQAERALAEVERVLQATRNRAAELERVCQEMADSLPWRLGEQGRRILERVAPRGSVRRKLWKGSVSKLKGWLRKLQGSVAVAGPAPGTGAQWGPTEPLVAGVEYGQWLRAERGDLTEVRILIGTHGRANTCDLEFGIKADPSDPEPLRAVTLNARGLTDNAYHAFAFPPIPDSEGKLYYIYLRSPDGAPDNAIAVWCRPAWDPDLVAMVDGKRQAVAWRYLCRYGDEPAEKSEPVVPVTEGLDLDGQYQLWLQKHRTSEEDLERLRAAQATWRYRPLVSVVMPVYDVEQVWLERAIESILAQVYPNWELCIADDASTAPHVQETIRRFAARDGRIRTARLPQNLGIGGASNAALALATGQFVALLDHDDELEPEALYEVVKLLQAYPEADMIYSDEDKLAPDGRRVAPFFKPDWSPDMFRSHMYTCHLGVYRKSLVDQIGGFRTGYDGSQDYDLVLRLIEHTDKIFHIPKVLYHWRAIAGSTARAPREKDRAYEAGIRALREHLERTGTDAVVEEGKWHGSYRVRYRIEGRPLVSIIVPTKDRPDLLERCVRSIEERSTYPSYEIVIVDNQSAAHATLEWLADAERRKRARVLRFRAPFNFSAINNFAVARARGDHVVLLNNDTEVLSPEWLEAMLEHSQRKEIGAVGAKLLYPDGSVQHAGVILGLGGVAGHSHRGWAGSDPGYFGIVDTIRNYSAVTFACAMIRKAVYEEVGGMNERELGVAFNDVDFCLRIRAAGYRIAYTPYAELYHHESASRGYELNPNEVAYMRKTWEWELARDPYYNPNLTTVREDFSLNLGWDAAHRRER